MFGWGFFFWVFKTICFFCWVGFFGLWFFFFFYFFFFLSGGVGRQALVGVGGVVVRNGVVGGFLYVCF